MTKFRTLIREEIGGVVEKHLLDEVEEVSGFAWCATERVVPWLWFAVLFPLQIAQEHDEDEDTVLEDEFNEPTLIDAKSGDCVDLGIEDETDLEVVRESTFGTERVVTMICFMWGEMEQELNYGKLD